MAKRPNHNRIWLALVYTRKDSHSICHGKILLFLFNIILKFYNDFAIHKAIGKQVSLTRLLSSGIFGIFSHTLTQLIAEAQD